MLMSDQPVMPLHGRQESPPLSPHERWDKHSLPVHGEGRGEGW